MLVFILQICSNQVKLTVYACHRLRNVLHRCDRAVIYIFIAASYFPWLSLTSDTIDNNESSILSTVLSSVGINSFLAADLRWSIWFLAAVGILYQQIFHEKYKWLETVIYIVIALIPALPFLNKVHSLI